MGKASRFFKSLLGFKSAAAQPPESNKQPKRRWSFAKSRRENQNQNHTIRNNSKSIDGISFHHHRHNRNDNDNNQDERTEIGERNEDPNKRAIALAAATAAVVDAAVVAAQAAAEVVRMTSRTAGYGGRYELAAVKIQSCFRAYLVRFRQECLLIYDGGKISS